MKKQKFLPGDPVLVLWRDIITTSTWRCLHEDSLKPPVIQQLGFFISQDSSVLRIASGQDGDCEVLGETAFPVGAVISIRKIKL